VADREVNVVLTRVPQECGHDLVVRGNRWQQAAGCDD
jgi:hypothetical protein